MTTEEILKQLTEAVQRSTIEEDGKRGPKELVYDTYISPLMSAILSVCKQHDIRMFNIFKLDGTMRVRSCLAPDKDQDEDLKHMDHVGGTGDVPMAIPFHLTKKQLTDLCDGHDPESFAGKLSASGNWLAGKLRDADCPEGLITAINFASGQRAAHQGFWRAAFASLRLFERGLYNPPGEELAMALLTGQPLPERKVSEAPPNVADNLGL